MKEFIKRHLKTLTLLGLLTFISGFDFTKRSIPVEEIQGGGPPKDGIPAITDPKFVGAGGAAFLSEGDRVLGVVIEGEARAYPVRILNWHEAVNDTVGKTPILATW